MTIVETGYFSNIFVHSCKKPPTVCWEHALLSAGLRSYHGASSQLISVGIDKIFDVSVDCKIHLALILASLFAVIIHNLPFYKISLLSLGRSAYA